MQNSWLAFEHYRIHLMELWPDGPEKEAGLSAARSALEKLTRIAKESSFRCTTCASRRHAVIAMPSAHHSGSGQFRSTLAA
jgi:hypothetical protein